MCGITGVLDARQEGDAEAAAMQMAGTLSHRGPDAKGVWASPDHLVAFGHTRLAVIDLTEAGAQPMTSRDGRWTVTYNGELYNLAELRRTLMAAGVMLRGTSDTEVLVEALAFWGLDRTLDAITGMYAFGAWDGSRRLLHLVRDRIGEKPLYYGVVDGLFVFASELKALRSLPGFTSSIDRRAIASVLRYSFIPAPHSIYEGVSKLAHGTVLSVRSDNLDNPTERAYWSAEQVIVHGLRNPLQGDEREIIDELELLLRRAVSSRMVADVPLGTLLSGGIDSSLVTALAQAQSSQPIRTFSVDVGDPELSEGAHARRVAQHLGTDHTELRLNPDDALTTVQRLSTIYDEPFADPSQIPTILIAAAARQHVTVALTGDGGDELFGGYNRYTLGAASWNRMRAIPRPARAGGAHAVATVVRLGERRLDRLIGGSTVRKADKLHKLAAILPATDIDDLYLRAVSNWFAPPLADGVLPYPLPTMSDLASADAVSTFMARDAMGVLPDNMLVKIDRATMATSLEARVPLLDPGVFAYAWRIPPHMRIRKGQGKWPLRQVLRRYVPDELIERPKIGFDPPIADWLRGPLRSWADARLAGLAAEGMIDAARVDRAWRDHLRGVQNHDYRLWAVLLVAEWIEGQR